MNVERLTALVASPHWRWMPGMRVISTAGWDPARIDDRPVDDDMTAVGWRPDLDDPATLGCLLALVREAWGDVHRFGVSVRVYDRASSYEEKWVAGSPGFDVAFGSTYRDALVAALLAAPERKP